MKRDPFAKRWAVLSCLFLLFFVLSSHHYREAKVDVTIASTGEGEGRLYWDSGAGFNERESVGFIPHRAKDFEPETHVVTLERSARTDPRSAGTAILLERVRLDGQSPFSLPPSRDLFIDENGYRALMPGHSPYTFQAKFKRLELSLVRHRWAGCLKITVDGRAKEYNLYSEGTRTETLRFQAGAIPGAKELSLDVPRIPLHAMKLVVSQPQSQIQSVRFKPEIVQANVRHLPDGAVLIEDLRNRAVFHPLLAMTQLLLAVTLAWVILRLLAFVRSRQAAGRLFGRDFWLFWGFLVFSLSTFSFWMLGQWPGIMTLDSYNSAWREIKTFVFTNSSPWVYNLYVLALTQLYDSPAIVGIFQIIMMAVMGSYVFFQTHRQGAPLWVVIPSFVLFATSIPIGLYNLTIWKDIPFCMALVFLGFAICQAFARKWYLGKVVSLSSAQIVGLASVLFIATTFRFNGIIYLATPLIIFALGLFTKRSFIAFVSVYSVLMIGYYALTPALVSPQSQEFMKSFSNCYKLGPLAAIHLNQDHYSPTPAEDLTLFNAWVPLDELRHVYTPVLHSNEVKYMLTRWKMLSADDQERLSNLYWRSAFLNPHLFLSDRVAIFIGGCGLSKRTFVLTNELNNPYQQDAWRPIESYRLARTTWNSTITQVTEFLMAKSLSQTGTVPLSHVFFNHLPALVLLAAAAAAYAVFPSTAVYAGFILLQVPVMFIIYTTGEWRYLYFLTLGAYFVPAIAAVDWKLQTRLNSHDAKGKILRN